MHFNPIQLTQVHFNTIAWIHCVRMHNITCCAIYATPREHYIGYSDITTHTYIQTNSHFSSRNGSRIVFLQLRTKILFTPLAKRPSTSNWIQFQYICAKAPPRDSYTCIIASRYLSIWNSLTRAMSVCVCMKFVSRPCGQLSIVNVRCGCIKQQHKYKPAGRKHTYTIIYICGISRYSFLHISYVHICVMCWYCVYVQCNFCSSDTPKL